LSYSCYKTLKNSAEYTDACGRVQQKTTKKISGLNAVDMKRKNQFNTGMPIYEYQCRNTKHSCEHCRHGFECMRTLSDPPLEHCPECGSEIVKLISAAAVGSSKSGFDDRAKSAGFHKLRKISKGEYEKEY